MHSKYKFTNINTGEVVIGNASELEEIIGLNRIYYDWYSNQDLIYGLTYKIERVVNKRWK